MGSPGFEGVLCHLFFPGKAIDFSVRPPTLVALVGRPWSPFRFVALPTSPTSVAPRSDEKYGNDGSDVCFFLLRGVGGRGRWGVGVAVF